MSTFTTVRRRKISEKKESCPSLQSLARGSAAVLALISNNQEERKVAPLA